MSFQKDVAIFMGKYNRSEVVKVNFKIIRWHYKNATVPIIRISFLRNCSQIGQN